nr:cytochrome P450 82A3-like [Quercus suber]
MADKYGALFTIKLGSYPTLVLSSSEIAKEFFTTNDLAVSLRPRQLATEHLGYDYAMFGFGPYGPYRRELRFYPASRLSAPRVFSENCIIGGYHVPKGTRLITNLWKIQTDPPIWLDLLEFKPERFLTTHKIVDVRSLNFELLPFGSGKRACPRISFALQMVPLALASFLHVYDISMPLDAKVDMTETTGLTNHKATPLEVLIKPRLHLPSFMD